MPPTADATDTCVANATVPRGFTIQELCAVAGDDGGGVGCVEDVSVPVWLLKMRSQLEHTVPAPSLIFPGKTRPISMRHACVGCLRALACNRCAAASGDARA